MAMSRITREQTVRKPLAGRMSLQFDQALSEAAGTLEALGTGWDDSGGDLGGHSGSDGHGSEVEGSGIDGGRAVGSKDGGRDADPNAADDAPPELLPLELQLADFERALDTILEQRDRTLYGYGEADGAEANPETDAAAPAGVRGAPPSPQTVKDS